MSPTFVQTTIIRVSYLLILSLSARAALIPALPQHVSVISHALALSLSPPSPLGPSATTTVKETANQAAGLNPFSLASTLSLLPTLNSESALENIFNGINVAFTSSSNLIGLASLASTANQLLPTASGLLQVAVPSFTSLLPPISLAILPVPTAASVPTASVIQNLPASCIDVFNVASLPPGGGPSTLITLQPACSPLSVFVDDVRVQSGAISASAVPLSTTVGPAISVVPQTVVAPPLSIVSPGFVGASLAELAAIPSQNVASIPSIVASTLPGAPGSESATERALGVGGVLSSALLSAALASPIVALATPLPQATGNAPLILPVPATVNPSQQCTPVSTGGPTACSLQPGSVQPVSGNQPCGTCPVNAGLQGIGTCPWLCSISFIRAGVYSCSPIDLTGQSFPDSSNNSVHLAEAVCHQCAAPSTPPLVSSSGLENAATPSTPATVEVQTTSNALSCMNLPSSATFPCCEPYGSRGNLVCSSCPVDPAALAVCPWLCRMPYVQGRIDLECSPVDLTGINLLSPSNETVQCESCRPGCSPYSAIPATTTCALSTTVSDPLTPTSLSALLTATAVSSAASTCTVSAPGLPSVTCTGGPDFSTLFCPNGCPTVFTSQCAFFCTSSFGSGLGGLFPAVQCATIDLSLISPGTLACQQCYPQCQNGSSTITSPSPLSKVSNNTVLIGSTNSTESSNNATFPTVTLSATSIPTSSPTCAIVSPGAVDSPVSQDAATGLLFRSNCGISAATVAQCPFLCSQGGGAFFQECSNTDISGRQPIGQFPPLECTHCLPPCGSISVSSVNASSSGFPASTTAAASSEVGNSSTSGLFPTASVTAPSPDLSTSGSANQSTSASVLVAFAELTSSPANLSFAPEQSNQSTLAEALAVLTSLASSVISLPASIPSSTSSDLASSTSTSSNATNPDIPSSTLASSNSASSTSSTSVSASLTLASSTSASSTSASPISASSTSASPTSSSSTSASSILTSSTASSGPTCTSIVPSEIDTPAIVEPNTGLIVRSSCGFTADTIAQCPFICSPGGGAPNGKCSKEDMTGRLMYGSYPPIVCHQCLPPCEAATTASAGPTCSSIAPNTPDPSPLIDLSGLLRRDSCGTSASSVAACPYLCGLQPQGLVSKQCFFQDLTNKTIIGQAASGLGLLTCEKCLPPCGKSALPSCRRNLPSVVNSVAGALLTTIPDLVGSIQIQPLIGAIPTSLVSVPGSIDVHSIIGVIPSNVPAIIGGIPTAVPTNIPTAALTFASIAGVQSIVGAVVPTNVQALAGSIEPQIAATKLGLGSVAALPNKAISAAAELLPTSKVPVKALAAPSLPIKAVSAVPSAPIMALKPGGLFPPVMAERDLANALQGRDVVDTIIEGSPAAQLQLTCGDTSEAVAACPFLCSPMNGEMQGFRRCAAVDLTNNYIGVNRVTCEKCLPLCLD